MRRCHHICATFAAIVILFLATRSGSAQELSPWDGDWITDFGQMSIAVEDGRIFGSLGQDGELSGTADAKGAELTYKSKKKNG